MMRISYLGAIAITLIYFFTGSTHAAAWANKESWTPAWEDTYRKYLEKTDFTSFCTSRNLYTYCSATAYQIRAQFSAENGLPFAIHAKDKIITNSSSGDWDKEPDQKRKISVFVASLRDKWFANTDRIKLDTYPILHESIKIGDLFLEKGHVRTIKEIRPSGLIVLLSTTETNEMQDVSKELFTEMLPPTCEKSNEKGCGFRRFYRLQKDGSAITPDKQVSIQEQQDQYVNSDLPYFLWVSQQIRAFNEEPTFDEMKDYVLESIKTYVTRRGLISLEIQRKKYANTCIGLNETKYEKTFDKTTYDQLSTFSRDHRLAGSLFALYHTAKNRTNDFWLALNSVNTSNEYKNCSETDRNKAWFKIPIPLIAFFAMAEYSNLSECQERHFQGDPYLPFYQRWPVTVELKQIKLQDHEACAKAMGISIQDVLDED